MSFLTLGLLLATSNSPYLDQLRNELSNEESPTSENYSKQQKNLLNQKSPPLSSENYTQKIKDGLEEKPSEQPYLETEKAKLLSQPERESSITAFKEGRSELKMQRTGKISGAFSMKVGVSANRNITSLTSAKSFNEIFGTAWTPDFQFSYEFQPFHSEWFGNIGVVMSTGVTFNQGFGVFQFSLTNPKTLLPFDSKSKTKFSFFTFPAALGLNYRFNLLRILRPYIQAQPALIGYVEARNDAQRNQRGFSKCLIFSGGVNLLLDWISPRFAWDLYTESGIKHYYLTVDYTQISTFSSDVIYNVRSWSTGLTYEF